MVGQARVNMVAACFPALEPCCPYGKKKNLWNKKFMGCFKKLRIDLGAECCLPLRGRVESKKKVLLLNNCNHLVCDNSAFIVERLCICYVYNMHLYNDHMHT